MFGFDQDRSEALSSLSRAIEKNPNKWKLFAKRGDFHRVQRNWKAAIDDYNSAIDLRPNVGLLYMRRAETRLRVGQRSQAVEDFIMAIRHSPLVSSERYLDQIRNSLTLGKEIVPESAQWKYTTTKPPVGWEQNTFGDSGWPAGRGPFGLDTAYLDISLEWRPNALWWNKDIWLRYTFTQQDAIDKPLVLNAYVNDFAEVFINGVRAAEKEVHYPPHWWEGVLEVASGAKLKQGENVLAVHCQNRYEKGYGKIDVGLYLRADEDSSLEKIVKSALKQTPDRTELHASLANQYVPRRQWNEAANCFDRLSELSSDDALVWQRAAVLSVYIGNLKRYDQLRSEMLTRFAETNDAEAAEKIAKACLLTPPKESDLPAIHEMVDKALTLDPGLGGGWFIPLAQGTKALAEYRSDNNQAAIEWAKKGIAKTTDAPENVAPGAAAEPIFRHVLCLEALARVRLGDRDSASTDVDDFKQFVLEQSPLHTGAHLGTNWQDWMMCEILFREFTQEVPSNKNSSSPSLRH